MADTDRELLELAAKAAGMVLTDNGVRDLGNWEWLAALGGGLYRNNANGTQARWNPLTDDGDALRLAVTKRFTIKDFAPHHNPEIVQAPPDAALWGMVEIWREDDNDPLYVEWYKSGADRYAATRRAIVRAAAAIGKEQA